MYCIKTLGRIESDVEKLQKVNVIALNIFLQQ